MNSRIQYYLVKQTRSKYWQMRYTIPGEKERAKSLGISSKKAAQKAML